MDDRRRALLLNDPWPQLVPPAVPRWVPISPDHRTTGQARALRSPAVLPAPRWETALESALVRPALVVITPEWQTLDPDIVGSVRITVGIPGGPAWEREVDVPGWGLVSESPAGIVQVDARIEVPSRRWWVGVSPGYAARSWTPHERTTTVAAATTIDVDPPPYAVRARIVCVTGSVAFPDPLTPPLTAGQSLEVPATRVAVLGVAATSDFLLQWEVFS